MYEEGLNVRKSRVDWPMMLALLGLMLVGVAFIYSATSVSDLGTSSPWFRQRFLRQAIWYAVGASGALLFCWVDYHQLARWSLVAYWATIVLLTVVCFSGVAASHHGSRRWIDLGPFQFQPSEFAKLTFILFLANFLSRPKDELQLPPVFLKAVGMALLPFVLILKEPDLGSALVLMPVGLAMMFVAGVPRRYLGRLLAGVAVLVALVLVDVLFAPPKWQIKLKDYQRRRLLVYFGRDFAPRDATQRDVVQRAREERRKYSYNVEQALISVGSGGLTGKGWRQGTQNALGYLPRAVADTDFIFSVIAEETGFAGSVVVITLYTVVLFSGLRIAGQARDRLGKLVAVGAVTLLFSHVFINIGMNISLMPVTGIPLPLLSYGGSSVVCSLVAIGILQNVYIHRRNY